MTRQVLHDRLSSGLIEKRRFLQVLAGPRQVGKTTLARQAMATANLPSHYVSADEPTPPDATWIEQQWDVARLKARESEAGALLVIDEVQRVPGWSDTVKLLWDADTQASRPLKVLLLGSSLRMIQSGLTERLAGRFELIPVPHWSFAEMREAFGWDLETFIYHGAYPGAAPLMHDPERWREYIVHSVIEAMISRDILELTRVDEPDLLRRLFHAGCEYSGQTLTYHKMLGQLRDADNTVTVEHYLDLLHGVGMVAGLSKYSHGLRRERASSPKLQVLNTALMTARSGRTQAEARQDADHWGRLLGSCVGAHLVNTSEGTGIDVTYWRDRNHEVDFVLHQGNTTVAIEVNGGRRRDSFSGMEAFTKLIAPKRKLLVGGPDLPLEEFLMQPAAHWLQ